MKLYLDTTTGLLSGSAQGTTPIRKIDGKRGDTLSLEVVAAPALAEGATGVLAAKVRGSYAGAPVALAPAWTAPTTEGAGYVFDLSLNSAELDALFTAETAEVVLMAEITWTAGTVVRSSQTFDLVVARDVWRGDEAAPMGPVAVTEFHMRSTGPLQKIFKVTIDDDGVFQRAAVALLALFAFAGGAMGQTVRDLTTTNGTLQGTSLRINTATNFDFGGVGGSLAVEAQGGNHAIAAKASDETDGAAFYGWSLSGAPAMKLVQETNFTSPALTVWRREGDYTLSPTVLIAGTPADRADIALSVRHNTTNVFTVNYYGLASVPAAATVTTQIDWAVSSTFTHNLTGNKTFTFTNSADGQTIIVRVVNPAAHSVTWPSVKWRLGTPPTQTASGTDIYTFINIGGTIYGAQNADLR